MATIINNSASATFSFGDARTGSAQSNIATASLLDEFSISGIKGVLNTTYRPGENLTYYVQVQNTGTSTLYNVTVSDDLGGEDNPLTFVEGSAYTENNGVFTPIVPTSTRPLVFTLPEPLTSGQRVNIIFLARADVGTDAEVTDITNTATVTANSGSPTGAIVTADPSPTVTISLDDFANVTITKSVSDETLVAGVPFSYTFVLENVGNLPALGVVITDTLPDGFVISSITATTDGVTTVYDPTDYSLDSTNTLTLPTNEDKSITVPAATATGEGRTTIVVTGAIN